MAPTLKPASTFVAARVPLVDLKTGMGTWNFLKILQDWDTQLRNGLSSIGQLVGNIDPVSRVIPRPEGIGVTLQFLDDNGQVLAGGIDFARAYLNKDTDHIADGTGSPLAGGKAAYIALVTSPPPVTPSQWINGLVGGVFTESQPAFADVSGVATSAQVPPLSAISGQITTGQLPAGGISGTIVTAKLTVGGTNGSMTFTQGLLTGSVAAT